MTIENLSYAIFDGVVNPAELQWFGINIQDNWSCHHVIEHIVRSEGQTFSRVATIGENNAVNCIKGVHSHVKLDF